MPSRRRRTDKEDKAPIKPHLLRAEAQKLQTSDHRPSPISLIQTRPDLLSAPEVLQLQHTLNNRTVNRLLGERRQPALSPQNPIQRLKTTQPGFPAGERKQAGLSLAAGVIQRDGTGMAGKKRVKSYTKAILANRSGWDGLSQLGRINLLLESANAQLTKVGAPEVRGLIDPFGSMAGTGDNAAFNRGTWQVFFNPDRLGTGISDEEFGRFANTVYHECRHAEQTFRVARKLAREGADAPTIAQRISIPENIARQAMADPLPVKNKQEWAEAAAWQLNMEVKEGQDQSLADLVNARKDRAVADYGRARSVYRTLQKLFADPNDPTVDPQVSTMFAQQMQTEGGPELLRARLDTARLDYIQKRELAKQAYLQYAKMPVEEDAWAVGALVEKQLGLPPHTAEEELNNLDEDERQMMPIVVVALSTGSEREQELIAFLQRL